jgi:hypothetical protein
MRSDIFGNVILPNVTGGETILVSTLDERFQPFT